MTEPNAALPTKTSFSQRKEDYLMSRHAPGEGMSTNIREKALDQILRIRTPGGPLEGGTAVGNALLSLAATGTWIASASSACSAGRGEKIFVSRTEG
jgi:hypothetical protein